MKKQMIVYDFSDITDPIDAPVISMAECETREEAATDAEPTPATTDDWKQLYEDTREMLTAYIDNFQLLQDEYDEAVDALGRVNDKKAKATKLVAKLKTQLAELEAARKVADAAVASAIVCNAQLRLEEILPDKLDRTYADYDAERILDSAHLAARRAFHKSAKEYRALMQLRDDGGKGGA